MRLFLGRGDSLRAGSARVRRGVRGAPAGLRSKPGAPRTHVRLAAEHRERQAAEVGERWALTVADHPEQRRGLLHRCLGSSHAAFTLPARAHGGDGVNHGELERPGDNRLSLSCEHGEPKHWPTRWKCAGLVTPTFSQLANEEQKESEGARQHVCGTEGEPDR